MKTANKKSSYSGASDYEQFDQPRQIQIGLGVRLVDSASPGATLFVQMAVEWIQHTR